MTASSNLVFSSTITRPLVPIRRWTDPRNLRLSAQIMISTSSVNQKSFIANPRTIICRSQFQARGITRRRIIGRDCAALPGKAISFNVNPQGVNRRRDSVPCHNREKLCVKFLTGKTTIAGYFLRRDVRIDGNTPCQQ